MSLCQSGNRQTDGPAGRRWPGHKRALALVALATALVFSTPLVASSLTFQLNFGQNGGGSGIFSNTHSPGPGLVFQNNCMGNGQIKAGLRNQGFTNVRFIGERYSNQPRFSGVWNAWVYTMYVDRCTGNAFNVQQVRPAVVQATPYNPPPPPAWWLNEPRPYGGNSDIIYHRD
ncbi:MAG TPA: hypothetical protein ENJ90_12400 [Devosia sp.]|nr:hypothetical protein [Devosia sp.]